MREVGDRLVVENKSIYVSRLPSPRTGRDTASISGWAR